MKLIQKKLKNPQNQIYERANQSHGAKLQKPQDEHHIPYAQWWPSQYLCYKNKQQTHGTNKWAQLQDCPKIKVTTMKKQNIPCGVHVLQLSNTHPQFYGQELYAPTIHHPLASIQVQLEGYLGLVVQHPTCDHSQHTTVQYASNWHTIHGPSVVCCTSCKPE